MPQTLDGTWAATSQPVGNETKFTLKAQNSRIVGAGTYRELAGKTGALAVAGVHSGAAVTLELAYDNASKATYVALPTYSTHMSRAFTVQGAGTSTLEFARQWHAEAFARADSHRHRTRPSARTWGRTLPRRLTLEIRQHPSRKVPDSKETQHEQI